MTSIPLSYVSLFRLLGLTLAHFLWQGALIAALLALGLRMLRKSSPNARYAAACLSLLLMAASPVITLESLSSSSNNRTSSTSLTRSSSLTAASPNHLPPASSNAAGLPFLLSSQRINPALPPAAGLNGIETPLSSDILDRLQRTGDQLLPWLAAFWFIGVGFFSLRLLLGCLGVRQLTREATASVGRDLEIRLARLSQKLGVTRPVKILQSAAVQVPGVIGWMPSIILIPVSALTQLSPAEIETILAHELAHIRRYDYLVNLAQTWIETLLFYHPAVWWVSNRIRVEREQCCDDLVLSTLNDRVTYARALANLAETIPVRPALALHAGDGLLLARIRRILGSPVDVRETPAAPPLALIGAALLLGILAASHLHASTTRRHKLAHPAHSTPVSRSHPAAAPTTLKKPAPASPAVTPQLYLSGQVVRSDDGSPLPGVIVALYRGLEVEPVRVTQTLQNGAYVMKAPSPGRYRLRITGQDVVTQQRILEVGASAPPLLKLVAQKSINIPAAPGVPITQVVIKDEPAGGHPQAAPHLALPSTVPPPSPAAPAAVFPPGPAKGSASSHLPPGASSQKSRGGDFPLSVLHSFPANPGTPAGKNPGPTKAPDNHGSAWSGAGRHPGLTTAAVMKDGSQITSATVKNSETRGASYPAPNPETKDASDTPASNLAFPARGSALITSSPHPAEVTPPAAVEDTAASSHHAGSFPIAIREGHYVLSSN